MGELKVIPISAIRENPVALRTVNRETEEYQGLVDSIRQKGFLGAITVRPQVDQETGEEFYELVDGLHRFTASKDAGLTDINVDVVSLDDDQVLEAQIMANIHKVETRPMDYTNQLKRILIRNSMMTEAELAAKLGKSQAWIAGRLSLNKIENEKIKELVNEGKICLSNAYALAKLPVSDHADWVDRAMTLPPDEFVPAASGRLKEVREAARQGRDAGSAEFQPVPHVRKIKALKDELESGNVGQGLVAQTGVSTPVEGFALGVAWALNIDPVSVEEQRSKDEERRNLKAEKKAAKAAERAKKKAEKAKKDLEEASKAAADAEAALQA